MVGMAAWPARTSLLAVATSDPGASKQGSNLVMSLCYAKAPYGLYLSGWRECTYYISYKTAIKRTGD